MVERTAPTACLAMDDPQRLEIARCAGAQIEALANMLRDAGREGIDEIEDLVIAAAVRMRQLAGVVMSAAADAQETAEALDGVLYG